MNYWWVNQGKTYAHEVGQDFMWSPLINAKGKTINSYDNMKILQPGDIVFSHSKKMIRAIGIVQSKAFVGPQPDFEGTGSSDWADIGWHCDVSFSELENPVDYGKYLENIRPLLPEKYAPLDKNGAAVLSYLFALPIELGEYLFGLIDLKEKDFQVKQAQAITNSEDELDDDEEQEIIQKENIGPLEKQNLVKSRRGQGIFKTNVKLYEKQCRVTGLKDKTHLTASHIKPWRKSDNREKIDGNNGLLLSPHIDRLFDHGFISFSDQGEILVSPKLNQDVLRFWNIDPDLNVGAFRPEQCVYLKYHRDNLFKK
jgi:putative restriction endonuclease